MTSYLYLRQLLEERLERKPRSWFKSVSSEIGDGASDARFCALLSTASRETPRQALAPSAEELAGAERVLEGWSPERWSLLETVRVALVLSRPDLAEESGALAIEEAFRYADMGEACALYRTLAHLPEPERFVWRAGEGCRSNMRSVFEAAALDTPFPARWFDDVAWRQAVIKCIFVEAPLWRMWGLDERLSPELARMALDLADERRSAQRPVQPDLWLCLGEHAGTRGLESIERELDASNPHTLGRRAAAYALARAGRNDRLAELSETEADPAVASALQDALGGAVASVAFRELAPA